MSKNGGFLVVFPVRSDNLHTPKAKGKTVLEPLNILKEWLLPSRPQNPRPCMSGGRSGNHWFALVESSLKHADILDRQSYTVSLSLAGETLQLEALRISKS